ncbi:MAG: aminopeptidase P family protein [Tannerellaceae bacterium]|jgi:Xaa-Pro aminopeptidase|nr:aminopeptidase P family protein [Tannerellaceae bacterium]
MYNTQQDKLAALRALMAEYGVSACVIPSSDPHMSEYVAPRWKARQWMSGFTGSAGTLVVLADDCAYLWTDSRYFLQAEAELRKTSIGLIELGTAGMPSIDGFLKSNLKAGDTVALDGQTYSAAAAHALQAGLAAKGIRLDTSRDLVGEIWHDRPEAPANPVYLMPLELSGQSAEDKIKHTLRSVHSYEAHALLLCALDEIAWTFNMRGSDVDYNPVALCYAYISEEQKILFVDQAKLSDGTVDALRLEGVDVAPYSLVTEHLRNLPAGTGIVLDKQKTNIAIYNAIPENCRIIDALTPPNHFKSIKNETELKGFNNALLRDGIALTRFYIWLEEALRSGRQLTEISVSNKLASLRAEQPGYMYDSFPTICGYAHHGAIVHYSATPATDIPILPEGILLIDSGAQYRDGTTDITRTIALSQPTTEIRQDFTRVLKGHIALATCRFPEGTRGSQIDVLARQYLWDAGINYRHGTGHGVGHCLNVHEGPQSIRMEENPIILSRGMILSNEPAMYRTNRYGIRTENLMHIVKDTTTEYGTFLTFETLTLCHIDTQLLHLPMLTAAEISWLNNYHQTVYRQLAPHLTADEQSWLRRKTQPIQQPPHGNN